MKSYQFKSILLLSFATLSLLLLAVPSPIQGAAKTQPLLLLISGASGGDLWTWTDAKEPLKQLTNWGYNSGPVISPDGAYVAYDSIPSQVVNQIACSGWPPFNIWVLEIATNNAVRIADQPTDVHYCGQSKSSFIRRPKAAWSPDSKWLAWGESVIKPDTQGPIPYQLVTYNLAQHQSRVIIKDLPGDQNITNGQAVEWSDIGILNVVYPVPNDDQFSTMDVYIYDVSGKPHVAEKFVSSSPCLVGDRIGRWVKDGDKTMLYLCNNNEQLLIDPSTQKQTKLTEPLELYAPNAPDGLTVFSTIDENGKAAWHISKNEQSVKDIEPVYGNMVGFPLDSVSIAPDGTQVAYITESGLFIYDQNGQTTAISVPLTEAQKIEWIGWGPIALRVRHK